MARLTQKQIAEKYHRNLAYFKKAHYFRRLRGWCFLAGVVLSVVGVLSFHFWGGQEAFSTGPITQNHAAFAKDCRVCHLAQEIRKPMSREGTIAPSGAASNASIRSGAGASKIHTLLSTTSLHLMDRACLQCHPTLGVHYPQNAKAGERGGPSEVNVVHSSECAACHREHVGPERMPMPQGQVCAACHNNEEELNRARSSFGPLPVSATTGENREFDGVIRFLAPGRSAGSLKPFASYAEGHPPFAYEQPALNDPATLKFSHSRHLAADIPQIKNRKLDCTDCHQPGADGVSHQPVKFEKHCQQCHSLQIQPSLPNLVIPHGDSEKVRYFLASLNVSIQQAIRAMGEMDPVEVSRRAEAEAEILRARGLLTLSDLEQRVFFGGIPADEKEDGLKSTASRKFLTECSKCHAVSPGAADLAPMIEPTNVAQQWVQPGAFTHAAHHHVLCVDCHQSASKSKETRDILLPSQKLCAECHRPPGVNGLTEGTNLLSGTALAGIELSTLQRRGGGARWDCISCHVFHAPAIGTDVTKARRSPPVLSNKSAFSE